MKLASCLRVARADKALAHTNKTRVESRALAHQTRRGRLHISNHFHYQPGRRTRSKSGGCSSRRVAFLRKPPNAVRCHQKGFWLAFAVRDMVATPSGIAVPPIVDWSRVRWRSGKLA